MTKAQLFKKIWRGGGFMFGFFPAETQTKVQVVNPDGAESYLTIPQFRAFVREAVQALEAWEGRER